MSEKYIWSKIILEKYIACMGTFIAPENPWLEVGEDSAKPYHDWNALLLLNAMLKFCFR
jgi:hypothetical protein